MHATKYFLFLSISAIMLSSSFSSLPEVHATGNQISLKDLGVLQLAAHDLFNVDRGDRINANTATDFENGKLDLSTLFTDMTTGVPFSLEDIAKGGEPRNRENIILFSVSSRIGQNYVQDYNNFGEQIARQNALIAYHSMFNDAYSNAFGESVPNPSYGCVTMTENLAFRTVHDFLPRQIQLDTDNNGIDPGDPSFGIFTFLPPTFSGTGLTDLELLQSSSMLDGHFDEPEFTEELEIIIQQNPEIKIMIPSLLDADIDFALQFNTEFLFTDFLTELESGSYASTDALDQIRNLIAKGYGSGCYIGGEIIPIDTTALLLANTQIFSWMIPVILSGIGIGLVFVRKR